METHQLDEINSYILVSLEDYKDYPINIGTVIGLNDNKTIAMLSDNTYVFRVKDSLLKLGFIKNNQVTLHTFTELYFIEELDGAEDILSRVLYLNKFKVREGWSNAEGFGTTFSKEVNGKIILVNLNHKKNLGNTVSINLLNENISELSIGFPRFSGVESIEKLYDCFQNMFGINLNTGMDTTSYSVKDSVVDQHLARICEIQKELSDEEFLNILENHPEYVEAYQSNCFSRELTREILKCFMDALYVKRRSEYETHRSLLKSEILKMERNLEEARKKLKNIDSIIGSNKSLEDLDIED